MEPPWVGGIGLAVEVVGVWRRVRFAQVPLGGEASMENRRCAGCGKTFRPRPQVPHQMYCSAADCQRGRRRCWQQAKRQSDADYRENQARPQRTWAQRHRDYWREYRRAHPEYCESNRHAARRRQRDRRHRAARIAKMDVSAPLSRVPSGTYRLVPAGAETFAKMDAWIVEMTLISKPYEETDGGLQKTT